MTMSYAYNQFDFNQKTQISESAQHISLLDNHKRGIDVNEEERTLGERGGTSTTWTSCCMRALLDYEDSHLQTACK